MRVLRASMIDILARDHILAGRAAGIPERQLLWNDALRNAMVPTLTVSGFAFGVMLSGTVLTEVIFNIPGIGRLLYEGILSRDYPLVQAIVLLNVLLFIGINFVVDLLYIALDPRLRG
jgi:peptide/nickel transport system permease protein